MDTYILVNIPKLFFKFLLTGQIADNLFWTSLLNKRDGLTAWTTSSREDGRRSDILVEVSHSARPIYSNPRDNSSQEISIYSSTELIQKQPRQKLDAYYEVLTDKNSSTLQWFSAIKTRTKENFFLYTGLHHGADITQSQVESDWNSFINLSSRVLHKLLRSLMSPADKELPSNIEYQVASNIQTLKERGWQRQFDLFLRQILMTWSYQKLHEGLTKRGVSFFFFYGEILLRLVWTLTARASDFSSISFATCYTAQSHYFSMLRECCRLLYCDAIMNHIEEVYCELSEAEQLLIKGHKKLFGACLHTLIPKYQPKLNSLKEICGKTIMRSLNYPVKQRELRVLTGESSSKKYLIFPTPQFPVPDFVGTLPVPCKRFLLFRQHYLTVGSLNCYFCANFRHDYSFHYNIYGQREREIHIPDSLKRLFLATNCPMRGNIQFLNDPSDPALPLYEFA